jgi:hypothetical protein
VSFEPITSIAAAPATASTVANVGSPPGAIIVSKDVTPIMPPGYTQTQTTKADGTVTTVITNATGSTVDTIYGTSTMQTSGQEVSLWA